MSQHFIWTPPFLTNFTFRPIVGQVSTGRPAARTLRSVVLPEFSNPTSTTSSFFA